MEKQVKTIFKLFYKPCYFWREAYKIKYKLDSKVQKPIIKKNVHAHLKLKLIYS